MSVGHYENFPVGSLLLPRRMRRGVHAVYHFARTADDIADEGDACAEERLAGLAALSAQLEMISAGQLPPDSMMQELARVIAEYRLPLAPFHDLLSAFSQDVSKTRYQDFAEIVDYCRRSANPVGRLMLALYGEHDSKSIAMSDGICTALQLINFLQDVAIDWDKGRVYLPQSDMAKFRVSEEQIARRDASGMWTPLMLKEIERARAMLSAGAPLGRRLKGRFGFEIRMTILGGERILQKLHQSGGDVFKARPVLQRKDWLYMCWRALKGS